MIKKGESSREIMDSIFSKLTTKEALELQKTLIRNENVSRVFSRDLEIKTLQIRDLERELLQANGLCSAGGILEFALKGSHKELGLKGSFNAATVCAAIVNCKL